MSTDPPPPAVKTTAIGLQLPPDLDFADWKGLGAKLAQMGSATQWCLADWVEYGSRTYPRGERYKRALEITGLSYSYLRSMAWVARQFPIERRRRGLSYSHHALVAALPPAEQDSWLEQAEEQGWWFHRLHEAVRSRQRLDDRRSATAPAATSTSTSTRSRIVLKPSPTRAARWQAAADAAGIDLPDWLARVADAACERPTDCAGGEVPRRGSSETG